MGVVEEHISLLPSLANQKMWDKVQEAIRAGWNVNSVLKVTGRALRVTCVACDVRCV
jgi:hypothetical protein